MPRPALPLVGCCLLAGAHAYPGYRERIPNGFNVKGCDGEAWPGVGHLRFSGGGPRNPFGLAFKAAGKTWTKELCNADSDGDGLSNGQELGDPNCVWNHTEDKPPQFDTGITHPGFDCNNRECPADKLRAASKKAEDPVLGCADYEHPSTGSLDVLMPGWEVGPGTSYVKYAIKNPASSDFAMTKFEFIKEHPEVVHHMLLYACDTDKRGTYVPPKKDEIMGGGCLEVVMAWAVGGSDFCTPRETALIAAAGKIYILEIHYDNPGNLEGIVDHSGMTVRGQPFAGSGLNAASVLITGARLPAVGVPPLTPVHRASVAITREMMSAIPETNVTLFAHLQHMHGIGVKQWLVETDPTTGQPIDGDDIACITNYDFDLQETVAIQPRILSRDMTLTLECVWDSSSRDWETLGGDATENEMCIIILFVTPAVPGNKLAQFLTGNLVFSSKADKICGCLEEDLPLPGGFGTPDSDWTPLLYYGVAVVAIAILLGAFGYSCFRRRSLGEPKFEEQKDVELS